VTAQLAHPAVPARNWYLLAVGTVVIAATVRWLLDPLREFTAEPVA